jgi:hypothetical protein
MRQYRFLNLLILKFGLILPGLVQAEEQLTSNQNKSALVMSLGSGIGLKYKYMVGSTIAFAAGIRYSDSNTDTNDIDSEFTNSSDSNSLGYIIEFRKYTSLSDTRYFFDIDVDYSKNENESTSISQLSTGTRTSIYNSTYETFGITLAFGLEHFLKKDLSVEAKAGISYSMLDRSTETTTINSTSQTSSSNNTDGDSWGFPVVTIGITKYW